MERTRHIHGGARFLRHELRKSERCESYRLRQSGATVYFRHHHIDTFLLDEVVRDRVYDVPSEVRAALGEPRRIVDLGANIGMATVSLLTQFPHASLVAFEPDPANHAVLLQTIAANCWDQSVGVIAACAGVRAGEVRFEADASPLSRQSASGTIVRPAVDVFPHLLGADLLKMDIEGAEWPILADRRLRQTALRAIVLEYHETNELSQPPFDEAKRLLEQAGFIVKPHHPQMLWAWRAVAGDAQLDEPPVSG